MGVLVHFPAMPARRAQDDAASGRTQADIVILPVVRIERHAETPTDDSGPEQGAAPKRRRRRARS